MSYTLCEKLRTIEPYEPISGSYRIRLDANESFVELPAATREDMLRRIDKSAINRYPDPLATEPCRLFAEYHGISPDSVTAGNGSDELLSIITQAFMMSGQLMTVLKPDFSMYGVYGSISELNVDVISKRDDNTIDVDAVIERINSTGSRLFIFSNPCNPTGLGICRDDVMRIVDGCPDCLVVVDEAYMDFWDQQVIDLAPERENMIVLRTCSKAFRMAGMRVGFAVCNKTLTGVMRAVKSPYNVNSLSQAAASAMLSHPDEIRAATCEVLKQRDYLYDELVKIMNECPGKFTMAQPVTNFVFIHMPDGESVRIFESLKAEGIVVRCMGCNLRVTAGSEEENREFLRCFRKYL